MTYVSRRTRITVSRWTDECDAEYILQASRKRSDGRLKRYTSCDDPRAWVNDNCIKNEYLVDFMSNGEFLGKPSFQLFGRFIPVPILFKLAQSSTAQNHEAKLCEKQEESVVNVKCKVQESYPDSTKHYDKENLKYKSNSRNENFKVKSDSNLTAVQWEKNALEKSLVKCTCLLNKALRKLEQIDNIVGSINEVTENFRNEEIQEAFYESKLNCNCSQNQSSSARSSLYNFSENLSSTKPSLKMQKARRTELLRKISGLRKKLKKIYLQEFIHQIRLSQQKTEKRSSRFQVTELCSCSEQGQINGLNKSNERLKSEKKRLISKMCQAFTALNAIKKSSKSYLESRKRNSMPNGNYYDFRNEELQEFRNCNCGCKGSDEFSDSEKLECFDSFSGGSDLNKKFNDLRQIDKDFCSEYQTSSTDFPYRSSLCSKEFDSATHAEANLNSPESIRELEINSKLSKTKDALAYKNSKPYQQLVSLPQKSSENLKEKEEASKIVKKSKIKFLCEEKPCRENIYADDLSTFENSPSKQMIILKGAKNIESFRPNTTPTTKREKLKCQNFTAEQNSKPLENISERRVKSEATMKEIEKTLRNYEQRLCDVESLVCRVEQLKEKSLEVSQLKKKLKKVKADAKKQTAADRDNSNRERSRLCSENWELKKKVQRLMKKSIAQNHNIQNLNCIMMKFECEAEELKKELTEYQVGFEHQQKYISQCEYTLAKWGAERENWKNQNKNMTTETLCSPCQDNRCIQRSRSYSPEKIKERIIAQRPKTQARGYRTPSEEDVFCYCKECEQLKGSRNFRQRLLPIRLEEYKCMDII